MCTKIANCNSFLSSSCKSSFLSFTMSEEEEAEEEKSHFHLLGLLLGYLITGFIHEKFTL